MISFDRYSNKTKRSYVRLTQDVIMKVLKSYMMLIAIVVIIAVTSLTSCIYDYDHCDDAAMRRIKIVFDWDRAPSADPAGMAVYFFPIGEGAIWRFDIASNKGGFVSIPSGSYHMLVYNNDTYDILFRDESNYEDYDAYTAAFGELPRRLIPDSMDIDIDNMHPCPDMLWTVAQARVDIKTDRIEYGDTVSEEEILCHPDELCAIYNYEIRNVKRLYGVKYMVAIISGMSPSVHMATGILGRDDVVLPVEAVARDNNMIAGRFYTFGRTGDVMAPNILDLYVELGDGRKLRYRFDVTRQVLEARDPYNVSIVIDGLELPESSSNPQGPLDVSVDDWTTIVVEYET